MSMKRNISKYLSAIVAPVILISLLCLSVGAVRQDPSPVALEQAERSSAEASGTTEVTNMPTGRSQGSDNSTTGSVVAVVIAVLVVIAVIALILIFVPKAKAKGNG